MELTGLCAVIFWKRSRVEEDGATPIPKIRLREGQGLYPALTGLGMMVNKSLLTCIVMAWPIWEEEEEEEGRRRSSV